MSYPPPPYQQPPYPQPPYQQPPQPPGYLPYATFTGPKRHSGFGISSFIIGVLTGVIMVALVIVAGVMGQQGNTGQGVLEVVGCVYLLGLLVCVAGAVFGIVGIKQQDRQKIFAVLGLCANGLVLLASLGVLALGLAMK